MIKNAVWVIALTLGATTSCKTREASSSDPTALPQARKILGRPEAFKPGQVDAKVLDTNMKERRDHAWKVVEQLLEDVPLKNPVTGEPIVDEATGLPLNVPRWQTWYEVREFKEMFAEMYWKRMTQAQRDAGGIPPDALIDDVMKKHHEKQLAEDWTTPQGDGTSRFDKYLAEIRTPARGRALNGVSAGRFFTVYSPDFVRHYLKHWDKAGKCETMLDPDQKSGTAFDFFTCVGEPMGPAAVSVKATWLPIRGDGMPYFDTTAKGIATALKTQNGTWMSVREPGSDKQKFLRPPPARVYIGGEFRNGVNYIGEYMLSGLHITTKETPDWVWASLWWSNEPKTDFGEDRPATIKGVWKNYKMCTSTTFVEGDESLQAAERGTTDATFLRSTDKSLAAALKAAYHFAKPTTWCSNPYIEFAETWAATNCVGCHQHAGPINVAVAEPDREQKRQNFATDFLWSFDDRQDSFKAAIQIVKDNPPE